MPRDARLSRRCQQLAGDANNLLVLCQGRGASKLCPDGQRLLGASVCLWFAGEKHKKSAPRLTGRVECRIACDVVRWVPFCLWVVAPA